MVCRKCSKMKTYFYATTMNMSVGYRTTNLSTWGLAFSRYSAKKGNIDNYQVTSCHDVQCFRSSKQDLLPCWFLRCFIWSQKWSP